MKTLIFIISLFYYNVCNAQVEIDLGRSLYVNGHDDWWYQQALPHHWDYRATTFEIGYHENILSSGNFNLSYGASWNYLGMMHMQSYAVQDSDYDTVQHKCIITCDHQSDFFGSGHDQGFSLTIEPSYKIGSLNVGLIAGAYLHKNYFAENIKQFGGNDAPVITNVTVNARDAFPWTLGDVFGVSVKKDNIVFKYQYFINPDHFAHVNVSNQDFPAAWHGTHIISIGLDF